MNQVELSPLAGDGVQLITPKEGTAKAWITSAPVTSTCTTC